MKKGIWGIWCGVGVLVFILNAQSASATMVMATDFGENDCSGFFGQGFGSCQIFIDSSGNQTTTISPVIIKFDYDEDTKVLSVDEINNSNYPLDGPPFNSPLFETVNGLEFTVNNTGTDYDEGTWSYDPNDVPGPGDDTSDPTLFDPGVKYWAAKAGPDFKLFWEVPESTTVGTGVCTGDPFSIACLNEALVVTSGSWTTPESKALSHLTLYDSEPATNGEAPPAVPEPATMLLLGTGLIGVAGAARRRKKKQI